MILGVASLAGALGAVCRYLVSGWVQERSGSDFPLGTLAVNLIGSFVFGLVVGAGDRDALGVAAGAGFLAGFTTFSTWMIETIRLGPKSRRALLNLCAVSMAGIAAAGWGYTLTN